MENPPGTFSTREAAKRLGVSGAMVKHFKDCGRLKLKERRDGRNYYDIADVEALAKTYKPSASHAGRPKKDHGPKIHGGEWSARVFQCFRAGMTNVADIVMKTKVSPEYVAECWEIYTMTPRDLLTRKRAEEERAANELRDREMRADEREKRRAIEKQKFLLIRAGKIDHVTRTG